MTALAKLCHLIRSAATPIYSSAFHKPPTSVCTNIMCPPTPRLPNWSLSSKTTPCHSKFCVIFSHPSRVPHSSHLVIFQDFDYTRAAITCMNCHFPFSQPYMGSYIFLRTLFSNTLHHPKESVRAGLTPI